MKIQITEQQLIKEKEKFIMEMIKRIKENQNQKQLQIRSYIG